MAEETVDHAARQAAALVKQAHDAHDDRCEERWAEARKLMDAMLVEIRAMRSDVDAAKGSWRMLLAVGGAVSAATAGISWIVQHLK